MSKKILLITDDAGESLEIYYAKHRFLEAGWRPVIASTQRKLLHGVIHDFDPAWNTYVRLDLEQAGGQWLDRQSVRDGRIITSQTWESHPKFYRQIFAALEED